MRQKCNCKNMYHICTCISELRLAVKEQRGCKRPSLLCELLGKGKPYVWLLKRTRVIDRMSPRDLEGTERRVGKFNRMGYTKRKVRA